MVCPHEGMAKDVDGVCQWTCPTGSFVSGGTCVGKIHPLFNIIKDAAVQIVNHVHPLHLELANIVSAASTIKYWI